MRRAMERLNQKNLPFTPHQHFKCAEEKIMAECNQKGVMYIPPPQEGVESHANTRRRRRRRRSI